MIHLAVAPKDRTVWCCPSVCGRFKTKKGHTTTSDPDDVTCQHCQWWIKAWKPDLVRKMFSDPEEV